MENVGGGGAAFAAPMIKRVKDTFSNATASTGYGLTATRLIQCEGLRNIVNCKFLIVSIYHISYYISSIGVSLRVVF